MNKTVLIEKNGSNVKIVVFNKDNGVESMFEQVVPVGFQVSCFDDMKVYLSSLPNIVSENIYQTIIDIFSFCFGENRKSEYVIFDDGGYEETVYADGAFVTKARHDKNNNITKLWLGKDSWQESEYDDRGNLTFQKFSNGTWIRAFYNEKNQHIFEGESNGKWRVWVHNEDGTTTSYDNSGFPENVSNKLAELGNPVDIVVRDGITFVDKKNSGLVQMDEQQIKFAAVCIVSQTDFFVCNGIVIPMDLEDMVDEFEESGDGDFFEFVLNYNFNQDEYEEDGIETFHKHHLYSIDNRGYYVSPTPLEGIETFDGVEHEATVMGNKLHLYRVN
jgi:hypothetical protein